MTALVLATGIGFAQAKAPRPDSPGAKALQGSSKKDLEAALFNLNLFEKKAEPVNQWVRAAWDVLSPDPHATFAGLALNGEFQKTIESSTYEKPNT